MAGLIRRETSRKIGPRRAGAENPKDPFKNVSGVAPGAAFAIFAKNRFRKNRLENGPLRLGQHNHFRPQRREKYKQRYF
jgi:hypothetical protein